MNNLSTASNIPRPRSSILEIAPYKPGLERALGGDRQFKLSSNESPLGTSEKAKNVYLEMAGRLDHYPDGSATSLRKAIGEVHGLNPNHIICGAGSDEILSLIAYAFLGPGDEAIYSEFGFLMYQIAIRAAGANPVVASEKNFTCNVDEILKKITPRTKVVYLANPNNPTGTYISYEEVGRLQKNLPEQTVLVLDAAYAEYVQVNDYESGIALVSNCNNVIMTRTFSKAFGLAGLRLGWAYAPLHIVDILNRIRGPFNVTSVAIATGTEAIKDRKFIDETVSHNSHWLSWLTENLIDLGLEVTKSVGNFILIHFPDRENKNAQAADKYLLQNGCILRAVGGYGLPNALRMTVGTEEANRAVVKHLTNFLKS